MTPSPPPTTTSGTEVEAAEALALEAVPLRRFTRFALIERYVDDLVTSGWWSEQFPDAPLEVDLRRRSRSATYSAATICKPDAPGNNNTGPDGVGIIWIVDGRGWGLETLLHELAHLAAGPGTGHGGVFRSSLGELWRHEAGFEAWAALQRAFENQEGQSL